MADNVEQRLSTLEANQSNIFHQLTDHKEKIDNITSLTIAIEKLAMKMDSMQGSVDNINNRMIAIEQKPVSRFEKIKDNLISIVISVVVGGLLGALMALIIK